MEQTSQADTVSFDLGTFEGFNFREQRAIEKLLSGMDVLNWDYDKDGEAEFWPTGDKPEVALVFRGRTAISASDLVCLERLLNDLGGDSKENCLRIYYALGVCGYDMKDLTQSLLDDLDLHIFASSSSMDVRKNAAYELFELYFPEAYLIWEKTHCDGLIFDTDAFLDSPGFAVEEVRLGDEAIVIVEPQ